MSIQYGDYTDIEMNPSQLSRALDIPIFELEYFILGVRDGYLDYQPNVVGFFKWLTDMLDGKNPKEFNPEKYLIELEKTKTRGLTTFYFNDRKNKDFQDYSGRQYNSKYEFGGKVLEQKEDKVLIEIRNKLTFGVFL